MIGAKFALAYIVEQGSGIEIAAERFFKIRRASNDLAFSVDQGNRYIRAEARIVEYFGETVGIERSDDDAEKFTFCVFHPAAQREQALLAGLADHGFANVETGNSVLA